jgi:large subunit ribosomal protein L13
MKKQIEKSLKTTKFTKNSTDANVKWYLVDANGKTLGRMASEVAKIIRGKNNPQYTPNTDTGDFVVVVNAEKVKLTGNRENLKDYKHHSLYPGGQKIRTFKELIVKHPDEVIRLAVRGMLPKTKLGNKLINKLKVYAGESHPHVAQNPLQINL